jgi:hypothetical protein
MSCRDSWNERMIGEVDQDLLDQVKAACAYGGLRTTLEAIVPPPTAHCYMHLELRARQLALGWCAFLGYN